MTNGTICPACGAPLTGANVDGQYKCKFCGNFIRISSTEKPVISDNQGFYQPDPPQSIDAYHSTTQDAPVEKSSPANPLPPQVEDTVRKVISATEKTRRIVGWVILGVFSLCVICFLLFFVVFRTGN